MRPAISSGVAGAVCYYGTQIAPYTSEQPRCPVLMHFGDKDPIATLEHAGALRAAQGALVEIQVYPAGHSFSCDETPNFPRGERRPGTATVTRISGRTCRVDEGARHVIRETHQFVRKSERTLP